ncbi:hypothetical protein J6590_034766 [Homalodisca vitripennis]|nr:hypothetical protein J6590_034766 [Homalodisca vitripennis]
MPGLGAQVQIQWNSFISEDRISSGQYICEMDLQREEWNGTGMGAGLGPRAPHPVVIGGWRVAVHHQFITISVWLSLTSFMHQLAGRVYVSCLVCSDGGSFSSPVHYDQFVALVHFAYLSHAPVVCRLFVRCCEYSDYGW